MPNVSINENNLEDWMIRAHLRTFAPHYTTSLDAALTLVPEGYDWSVGRSQDSPGTYSAMIIWRKPGREYEKANEVARRLPTPALANMEVEK